MKIKLFLRNLLAEVLNKIFCLFFLFQMSVVPFLIGVAGGPCSGKSTVCQKIVEDLESTVGPDQASRVTVIPMENFYKPKTIEQRDLALRGNYNLDHPDVFDEKLLYNTLQALLHGQTVKVTTTTKKKNFKETNDFIFRLHDMIKENMNMLKVLWIQLNQFQ